MRLIADVLFNVLAPARACTRSTSARALAHVRDQTSFRKRAHTALNYEHSTLRAETERVRAGAESAQKTERITVHTFNHFAVND